jgi:hypothetical protein
MEWMMHCSFDLKRAAVRRRKQTALGAAVNRRPMCAPP